MTVAIIVQGSVFANSNESIIAWGTQWGWSSAIQVPGDYDGDGVFDLAVYDPAGGYWYIQSLVGETTYNNENQGTAVGSATDPLVKIAGTMSHRSVKARTVTIFIRDAPTHVLIGTFTDNGDGLLSGTFLVGGVIQFSGAGEINYATGTWYLNLALPGIQEGIEIVANYTTAAPFQKTITWRNQWGWNGAIPVAGDYDGDGQSELAVVDPSSGKWYINTLNKTVILENQGLVLGTSVLPLIKLEGKFAEIPVVPGTVTMFIRDASTSALIGTFTDNGGGQLSGTFLVQGVIQFPGSGEVNYATGAWYVNLALPGLSGSFSLSASYRGK